MNVLPQLRQLDLELRPRGLTVLGIHSPKYPEERRTDRLRLAMARHGVRHPVASDPEMAIWSAYTVRAWPTLILIGPNGELVARHEGEFAYGPMFEAISVVLSREAAPIASERLVWTALPRDSAPLSFPGKVLAENGSLFVADTGHGRVLELNPSGRVQREFSGMTAPQGMAVWQGDLYVADPVAGAVYQVNLSNRTENTAHVWADRLRNPWDLAALEDSLWIAMSGAHQIHRARPGGRPEPFCGSGYEGLHDGPLGRARLAQPSGLAAVPGFLYVADSEANAVRAIDLKSERVDTLVGEGLFAFGDQDGTGPDARLQHPLGVAVDPRTGSVFVADTYNGKVRKLDPVTRTVRTVCEGLIEPGGLSFDRLHERLVVVDTNRHRLLWLGRDGDTENVDVTFPGT